MIVPSEGPFPCPFFLLGEQPGWEERRAKRPFVGPAGQELWARVYQTTQMRREQWYVANLKNTYGTEMPTSEEIAENTSRLISELVRCQPLLIVTVGYAAARWALPQFHQTTGDYFHGLCFQRTGWLPHPVYIVPTVHSSAALRQPERYQQQLVEDWKAVARVLFALKQGKTPRCHEVHVPPVTRVGLAGLFGQEAIGCDTEGSIRTPEALTLSATDTTAALVDLPAPAAARRTVQRLLTQGSRLYLHNAPHDLQVLAAQWAEDIWALETVEDPMLMAYHLGLPLSLKILAYRELRWSMTSYQDLVEPLDNQRVRATLERALRFLGPHGHQQRTTKGRLTPAAKVRRKIGTALRRVLQPQDERTTDEEPETLRTRWSRVVASSTVSLPPPPTWRDVPQAVREPYALTDAMAHVTLGQKLQARLEQQGLMGAYDIDRRVLPFLARNSLIGMVCDREALVTVGQQLEVERTQRVNQLEALVGHPVNPGSGDQVSDCLFKELGIRPTRPTKSRKHYTTEDKYLKARRLDHPAVSLIIEARQLGKLKTSYSDRLPDLLRQDAMGQWRYHPDWRYTRTATGRLAESIILLIPKHSYWGLRIRSAFHATEGHRLVLVDLSQIEMRVMAHLSKDPVLLGRYARNEDVHAGTAHDLLGAPKRKEDQDESLHRLPAKTMNFGIINGMTEFGMLDQLHEAGQLHWTIDQVREFRLEWFRLHRGVQTFWDEQVAYGRRKGYVKDLFGARRRVPGLHATAEPIRREAERQCLAAIQMTADRISKAWNAALWRSVVLPGWQRGYYVEPWVRVHDETVLEVDEARAEETRAAMLHLIPQHLSIPTTAEGLSEQAWGETKLRKLGK